MMEGARKLAETIEESYRADLRHPFPYADCRSLLQLSDHGAFAMLIPDLDLFCSTVYGWASSARQLLDGSRERAGRARRDLAASFFEKHATYVPLREQVREATTPELHRRLQHCERLREQLLELLALTAPEAGGP
jgi:hypothetical protein